MGASREASKDRASGLRDWPGAAIVIIVEDVIEGVSALELFCRRLSCNVFDGDPAAEAFWVSGKLETSSWLNLQNLSYMHRP